MKIYSSITKLLSFAQAHLGLDALDVDYVRNGILDVLSLNSYEYREVNVGSDIQEILDEFVKVAVSENVFEQDEAPYYCDKVMGLLSMRPAEINARFQEVKSADGAKAATDWFYDYCVANNYVKKAVLDKNPRFEKDGLIVTINLSKPEFRDPNKAKSGNAVAGGYPSCVICRANEGYVPRGKSTLRTVSIKLDGKDWFWQYSPYGYFNEHGIAVNCEHIPMRADKQTFVNLIDFVDQFPHYFIGCNAPLERIGGSVLAHDHYQGGAEVLPLRKASVARYYTFNGYDDVNIGIVDWAGSVVRVSGANKDRLIEVCEVIRKAWINYDNPKLSIISGRDGVRFSEISPTVYKQGDIYHMNIILRNNGVSKDYPDGIFHAHPEFHSIKKESIGLIEAQGLFILPGRLDKQLAEVEHVIRSNKALPDELAEFSLVYSETREIVRGGETDVHKAMQSELASICKRILQNTAVFKKIDDFEAFLVGYGFTPCNYIYKVSASGRANIIGEHIDYCGGKVLPVGLSLKNTIYVKPNGTDKINIRWTTLPDSVTLEISKLGEYRSFKHANYIAGCAHTLQQNGFKIVGCDLLYDCAVPFGSGLSSSAAIEVSTIAALLNLTGCDVGSHRKQIALMAQKTEREYAGVNCGIMDQYASAFGAKGTAILLDCKEIKHEYVPLNLGDYAFVIADTNKPHSLVASKYNERRAETEEGLHLLQHKLDVCCLADVTPDEFEKHKKLLTGKIIDRVEHVVYECQRVNDAVKAMRDGDLIRLGKLLNQSHASLKTKYEVSCKELDVLAETAQKHPACLGSRMTGAGFGGSTISIVKKSAVKSFKQFVGNAYKKAIGYDASFYEAEIENSVAVEALK